MEFNNQDLEKKIHKAGSLSCELRTLLEEIQNDLHQEWCESKEEGIDTLEDAFEDMAASVGKIEDVLEPEDFGELMFKVTDNFGEL